MVKKWEIAGIFSVIILGILLYFAYDFFKQSQLIGIIAPVNESVWEQLKMTFYAMGIFALIEYIFIYKECKNFIFAKAFSSILACFLVVVIYFGYTRFIGSNFYLNILTFVVAVIIAQFFGLFLLKMKLYVAGINYIGFIILIAAVMLLTSYTYNHPHTDLFVEIIKLSK